MYYVIKFVIDENEITVK